MVEKELDKTNSAMLNQFAQGLALLDDYDHESLDSKGISNNKINYPSFDDYMEPISDMTSDFASDVFAQPKDDSFDSSINQIKQSFAGEYLYPS